MFVIKSTSPLISSMLLIFKSNSVNNLLNCKVTETEPVVKGQTAANSFKPALLDNGVKVMVPPFIGQDEIILINTETKEYSERAS